MHDEKVIKTFQEFQTSFQFGNYDSASFNLALVYYCLPNLELPTRKNLEKQLEQVEITADFIEAAKQRFENLVVRLNNIISVGSRWDVDEIFLIIRLRVDIDILLFFLEKYRENLQNDLLEIDESLEAIATSAEHKRHFEYAIKMIKKNWEMPINSKWLDVGKLRSHKSN